MVETRKDWWKTHFDLLSLSGYGLKRKTTREVRGIVNLLALSPPSEILDLGCGAGRHALGLAKLGYRLTGLDWSAKLLTAAARTARAAGLSAVFLRGDMRRLRWKSRFNAVISLFTSFGYFETEAEDLAVLRGVRQALRPGGTFLIDVLNKPWLMRHFTPTFRQRTPDGELLKALNRLAFDERTSRLSNHRTLFLRAGRRRETFLNFKVYGPQDLGRLLEAAGMRVRRLWGGFDGRRYEEDCFRLIMAASPASPPRARRGRAHLPLAARQPP